MNAVVITAIDHEKSLFQTSNWSRYCIASWEKWCEWSNINLHVITEHDPKFDRPIWNRYNAFNLFPEDRLLLVDSDTIVSSICPNIFKLVDDYSIGGVLDNWNLWWLHQSWSGYKKFFTDQNLNLDRYINGGVLLFSREHHSKLCDDMRSFYARHKEELINWNVPNTGRDQTILNKHIQDGGYKLKIMDHRFNQHSMLKFDLFQSNWQRGHRVSHFLNTGYIHHFNGLPIEDRAKVMRQTWEFISNV